VVADTGASKAAVQRDIRSEAVILAIFGAVTGIMVGVALVASLGHDGVTSTVVPASRLLAFLVLSGLLGLVAATWPARRAARLDVLAAVATG
jgi:putative ABC transport system permease protein